MARTECVAECRGIVQIYRPDSGEVHALRGVDAGFEAGSVTAVVGPSGSGKSTLMRLFALLERPTAGELRLDGIDALTASARTIRRLRRTSVAVVEQRPTHNLLAHLTAREHVVLAAKRRGAPAGDSDAVLNSVGLGERSGNRPPQLSGGEQQRLAVAMATVGHPALVLADEPTAELDEDNARAVIGPLQRCASSGAAVVVNTHDPTVAAAADRVLALHHGTLHSERVAGVAAAAVIDRVGRVQLPPDMLALFPSLRAELTLEHGAVVMRPVLPAPAERPDG